MNRNIELTNLAEEKGWLVKIPSGNYWLLTPKMTKLIRKIQNIFLDEIAKPFEFEEWLFPRVIPEEAIKPTGWLKHHYSEAFIVSTSIDSDYHNQRHLLDPIQCAPLFYSLKNKTIDKLPLKVVECLSGWTWRNEKQEKLHGFFKSKSFLRVEFICIGNNKKVLQLRNDILEKSLEILNEKYNLELLKAKGDSCFIESPEYSDYVILNEKVKKNTPTIDIVFKRNKTGEYLELASASLHHDNIIKNFGITSKSEKNLHSACLGFGITRIAFVILEKSNFEIDI